MEINNTYYAAIKQFNSKEKLVALAAKKKVTPTKVVFDYCKQTLGNYDANRVADLVVRSLA